MNGGGMQNGMGRGEGEVRKWMLKIGRRGRNSGVRGLLNGWGMQKEMGKPNVE